MVVTLNSTLFFVRQQLIMGMAVKLFFCKSNNKIKKKKVEGKVFYEKKMKYQLDTYGQWK